jgi:hypothetical protein
MPVKHTACDSTPLSAAWWWSKWSKHVVALTSEEEKKNCCDRRTHNCFVNPRLSSTPLSCSPWPVAIRLRYGGFYSIDVVILALINLLVYSLPYAEPMQALELFFLFFFIPDSSVHRFSSLVLTWICVGARDGVLINNSLYSVLWLEERAFWWL